METYISEAESFLIYVKKERNAKIKNGNSSVWRKMCNFIEYELEKQYSTGGLVYVPEDVFKKKKVFYFPISETFLVGKLFFSLSNIRCHKGKTFFFKFYLHKVTLWKKDSNFS